MGKDTLNLAVEFSEGQAHRLPVGPEQLALATVMNRIAAEGPDFDSAASRVLEKNRELHRRLVPDTRAWNEQPASS